MGEGTRRVAILGGGMASLTAAYELTRPELGGAFEVTVYQQGWRLGGKGASGRNPHRSDRIEEHGLHVWMGFYENAFRLIRDCYGELGRAPGTPLATWQDAFKPHSYIVFDDVDPVTKQSHPWPLCFPEDPSGATPGDGRPLPTPPEYIPRILELIVMLLSQTGLTQPIVSEVEASVSVFARLEDMVVEIQALLVPRVGDQVLGWLRQLLRAALRLALHIPHAAPERLEELYHHIRALVDLLATPVLRLLDTPELRHTRLLFDFAVTHLRGLVADGLVLPPYDFSSIDWLDYRDWLRKYGAREETVTSAPVTALYDLVFAIDRGMAAGATIACATRMLLTYKGALFYKMQAGMGDTVFAPLYTVLKRRGVEFKFFHRVDELRLGRDAADQTYVIDTIKIGRQASTVGGAEYDPLVTIKDLPCWPSEPRWEQLTRGDALAQGDELADGGFDLESATTRWPDELPPLVLRRGQDFDDVVLGISIAALPRITGELMTRLPRYKQMIDGIETIRTQAMQLWFDTDLAGLGWTDPPGARCAATSAPIAGSYPESLDTWADMSHLIGRESWPDGTVKNIAYFCGQLRDDEVPPGLPADAPAREWDRGVAAGSLAWTRKNIRRLWPAFAGGPGGELDFARLHAPDGTTGAARWDAQYFRANVKPSERYVLTVPGSTKDRLYADDLLYLEPGCANLFLAGDWVRTGINGGCIEAATMAGMQAARAISGVHFDIVGDTAPFRARTTTQTALIERGGDVVYAEPYMQEQTRLYAFLLPVDRQRVAALCDRQLNWTGKYQFSPLTSHVALVFADIASTYSTDPRYAGRGTMSERDVSFWIPVGSTSPGAPSLSWFLPYIWVDNGIAMAAGREVYGFPKEVGTLSIPGPGEPLVFAVDTSVVERFGQPPDVGARGPRAVTRNVVTVAPSAAVFDAPHSFAASVFDSVRAFLRVEASGHLPHVADWFLEKVQAAVPMLFLKQVRDVVQGRRACYKALAVANSVPSNVRAAGILPGTFDVTVHGFASHPIVRELGLGADEAAATIRGCAGFFVDFDFLMERGRELWRVS